MHTCNGTAMVVTLVSAYIVPRQSKTSPMGFWFFILRKISGLHGAGTPKITRSHRSSAWPPENPGVAKNESS